MGLLYLSEHLNCFNYDKGKKPLIEKVKIVKGQKGEHTATSNMVVFIIEGRLGYTFKNCPGHDGVKGQILFVSSGSSFCYQVLANTEIIIFRITDPVSMCSNYTIERLYKETGNNKQPRNDHEPATKLYGCMEINARLWHFLQGISDCVGDGLKCRCWFEMKIKEFFLLVRAYYPKEEIHDFLYPILSRDAVFSEHIRKYWKEFSTVNELAAFMHMTPKQFSTRFVQVFGKTPYKWMTEGRAQIIHRQITSTTKLFKQIAMENGFTSDSLFTRFCKTTFGKTPSQIREGK